MEQDRWNDDMIFDLIPDGILAVNHDLVIIRMNRSAKRLLSIREDAVCEGQTAASVMEEDGFLRLRQLLTDAGKTVTLRVC